MAAVVSGVVVLAGGVAAGLVSARARRENPCAAGSYAPRDDSARDPLTRRLRHGYASVEIAVWLDERDRLLVGGSHDYTDPGAELERLILRPLADRIETFIGRVYPDTAAPFRLVIAIDEPDAERLDRAYERLESQLAATPTRLPDSSTAWCGRARSPCCSPAGTCPDSHSPAPRNGEPSPTARLPISARGAHRRRLRRC